MSSEADSSSCLPILDSISGIESKSSRGVTAYETWRHTRKPIDKEPEKIGRNRVLYCKYCTEDLYSTQATVTF